MTDNVTSKSLTTGLNVAADQVTPIQSPQSKVTAVNLVQPKQSAVTSFPANNLGITVAKMAVSSCKPPPTVIIGPTASVPTSPEPRQASAQFSIKIVPKQNTHDTLAPKAILLESKTKVPTDQRGSEVSAKQQQQLAVLKICMPKSAATVAMPQQMPQTDLKLAQLCRPVQPEAKLNWSVSPANTNQPSEPSKPRQPRKQQQRQQSSQQAASRMVKSESTVLWKRSTSQIRCEQRELFSPGPCSQVYSHNVLDKLDVLDTTVCGPHCFPDGSYPSMECKQCSLLFHRRCAKASVAKRQRLCAKCFSTSRIDYKQQQQQQQQQKQQQQQQTHIRKRTAHGDHCESEYSASKKSRTEVSAPSPSSAKDIDSRAPQVLPAEGQRTIESAVSPPSIRNAPTAMSSQPERVEATVLKSAGLGTSKLLSGSSTATGCTQKQKPLEHRVLSPEAQHSQQQQAQQQKLPYHQLPSPQSQETHGMQPQLQTIQHQQLPSSQSQNTYGQQHQPQNIQHQPLPSPQSKKSHSQPPQPQNIKRQTIQSQQQQTIVLSTEQKWKMDKAADSFKTGSVLNISAEIPMQEYVSTSKEISNEPSPTPQLSAPADGEENRKKQRKKSSTNATSRQSLPPLLKPPLPQSSVSAAAASPVQDLSSLIVPNGQQQPLLTRRTVKIQAKCHFRLKIPAKLAKYYSPLGYMTTLSRRVLERIFDNLSLADLLTCRFVCADWYRAVDHHKTFTRLTLNAGIRVRNWRLLGDQLSRSQTQSLDLRSVAPTNCTGGIARLHETLSSRSLTCVQLHTVETACWARLITLGRQLELAWRELYINSLVDSEEPMSPAGFDLVQCLQSFAEMLQLSVGADGGLRLDCLAASTSSFPLTRLALHNVAANSRLPMMSLPTLRCLTLGGQISCLAAWVAASVRAGGGCHQLKLVGQYADVASLNSVWRDVLASLSSLQSLTIHIDRVPAVQSADQDVQQLVRVLPPSLKTFILDETAAASELGD